MYIVFTTVHMYIVYTTVHMYIVYTTEHMYIVFTTVHMYIVYTINMWAYRCLPIVMEGLFVSRLIGEI